MTNPNIAQGFRFAGVHCGIRNDANRPDLAIILSEQPCSAAGVFTQNKVVAAPVQVCRQRLPSSQTSAVIICAGNANACTGDQGIADAIRMTELTAKAVSCRPDQVLVCSTGVIGVPLPMKKVEFGILLAQTQLAKTQEALDQTANAILTTDTHPKVRTRSLSLAGHTVNITGIAKGAAMIGPNMATMLAFVLTDAAVSEQDLARLAKTAADRSFNCISVEGHTSTNDTLLLLANGEGEKHSGDNLSAFEQAVIDVCGELARDIAADAEGASHLVRIEVEGMRSEDEAKKIAKTVAGSALVKTAIFGADPNWGRFVSAAGYAGVDFKETDLSLWLGETLLYRTGTPQPFDEAVASTYIRDNREIALRFLFTLGDGKCTFWTSDLTYEYVRLNAEYTT